MLPRQDNSVRFQTLKRVALFLLCVQVADRVTAAHYLDRYRPVAIYPLDALPGEETDEAESRLGHRDLGVPQLIDGARPFTSKAVDFRNVGGFLQYPPSGALFESGDIEKTTGLTVCFWIKTDDNIRPGNQRVMGAGNLMDLAADASGSLSLFLLGNNVRTQQSRGKLTDDAWHHVAVVADFEKRNENLVVYIDGTLNGFSDVVFDRSQKLRERDTIKIGARSSGGHPCHCVLDDVAIFNRPLAAREIMEILNGPVWIGPPRVAYGQRPVKLHAVTPIGVPVLWSKAAGRGTVQLQTAIAN